jgi:hypothetical protein
MPYNIGKLEFKTKKDSEKYVRNIINTIGENTINNTHIYYQFFIDLLNNHHKRDLKIGCGIDKFQIIQNARGTGFEVQICRVDGSNESFSWKDCATHTHKNDTQLLEVAMRTSIDSQIYEFRKNNIEKCAKCEKIKKCAVDHKEPLFNEIKNKFIADATNIPSEFDKEPYTHQQKFRDCDSEFERKWQVYHKNVAELQFLCSSCHNEKTKNDIKLLRNGKML